MSGVPAGRRLLLSVGDPNGIGPEIAVRAARELGPDPLLAPVLVGDGHVIERRAAQVGLRTRPFAPGTGPRAGVLDMVDVPALPVRDWRPGQVDAAAGAATVAYLSAAVDLVRTGAGRAVVACPHSETAVNAAGIPFRGYPPLLARLAGVPAERVFLMLVGGGLRVVHATLHERLADAVGRLTPELVAAAGLAARDGLAAMGVAAPSIGVFGINPHAGEGGLFGDDDERVTVPAVASLRARGLDATGPAGADVLLAARRHDAYVAMYHDQGHVPVKLLAGRTAAALTVGAGLLFASVGHGAAFDIAGSGTADPSAVLGSLRLLGGAAPARREVAAR